MSDGRVPPPLAAACKSTYTCTYTHTASLVKRKCRLEDDGPAVVRKIKERRTRQTTGIDFIFIYLEISCCTQCSSLIVFCGQVLSSFVVALFIWSKGRDHLCTPSNIHSYSIFFKHTVLFCVVYVTTWVCVCAPHLLFIFYYLFFLI